MSFSKTYALLFLLLAFSCGQKQEKTISIPAGILSKDTFSIILRDFALAESVANINVNNVPFRDMDSVYAFDPLKQHNIRQSQYDSTLQFYIENPELYKEVYANVLEMLSTMETARVHKKDSVSTISDTIIKNSLKKVLTKSLGN